MNLFKGTHIDFMKYRRFWILVSAALLVLGLGAVFIHGELNIGVDFAGGTQITVKFAEEPNVDRLRTILETSGFSQASIQRFGDAGEHQVMIRTAVDESGKEGAGDAIVAALAKEFGGVSGDFDLNQKGRDAVADKLFELDPDQLRAADEEAARGHYQGVADSILDARRAAGILTSFDEIARVPGVSAEVVKALGEHAKIGKLAVLAVDNVGPQIGEELRKRGLWAVGLSLLGMLAYIWIRFELHFAIGAVMASLHDVLVTVGIFAALGFEFNLTTVAAFLTIVGYSVNDTVVIFDRVRENLRKNRRMPLLETMNISLNETLSRTILVSGATFLACVTLLIFGGDVIRGFAFVMTVGVVVGTYSSIYVAGAFALLWETYFPQDRAAAGSPEAAKLRGLAEAKAKAASKPAPKTLTKPGAKSATR